MKRLSLNTTTVYSLKQNKEESTMKKKVYIMGGAQTDFERNWTKEGKGMIAHAQRGCG